MCIRLPVRGADTLLDSLGGVAQTVNIVGGIKCVKREMEGSVALRRGFRKWRSRFCESISKDYLLATRLTGAERCEESRDERR